MTYFLKSFADELSTALKPLAKVSVIYGDEGFERIVESGPYAQVLEDPAGDDFAKAPTTQSGANPSRFRKHVGVLIKIKGSSSKPGATIADHRGVADMLGDLIVIAAEEIAHAHGLDVAAFSGTTFGDDADVPGTNPASAFYAIRFKFLRGVNKAKSIKALAADLAFDNGVIAQRQIIPPKSGASITAVTGSDVMVSGLEGIDASMVGKTLTLDGGASEGNRGDFAIVAVLDESSVQITNASASLDTGLSWSVSDDELAQES